MANPVKTQSNAIKKYWAKTLIELGKTLSPDLDLEDGEWDNEGYVIYKAPNFCFACGIRGGTQRAHIEPRQKGGTDTADNLHLLCPKCHLESEFFRSDLYWHWFKNKDMDSALSERIKSDLEIVKFINDKIIEDGLIPNNLSQNDMNNYILKYYN
jgi:HNH endonuclease